MSNLRVCILERASALLDIPDCCMHSCSISSWSSSRSAFYKCEIVNLKKLMVIFQSTNKIEKSTQFQDLVKFLSGFSKERIRQSWKREQSSMHCKCFGKVTTQQLDIFCPYTENLFRKRSFHMFPHVSPWIWLFSIPFQPQFLLIF